MSELVLEKNNDIPNGWVYSKIDSICEVKGRIGWKGYTKADLRKDGYYVIGATHLGSNLKLDLSNPVFISKEKFDESPEIQISKGDIVLAQRGSLGKISIVEQDLDATINPNTMLLKNILIKNKFLLYVLSSPVYQEIILSNDNSSTTPMISQKFIKNLEVPLPPLNEQKRIVEKIEELFSLLDSVKLSLEKIKSLQNELRHSFLKFAFIGTLSEKWRKNNNVQSTFQEDLLGNLILFSKNGFTGRPNEMKGVPRLGIETVTQTNSIYVNETKHKFIDIPSSKIESYTAKTGDLFVCRQNGNLNYVGKSAVYNERIKPMIFSDSLIQLRPQKNLIMSEYLAFFINSKFGRTQIEKFCSTTAGNYSVNGTNLKKTKIIFPSIEEQKEIVSIIEHGFSIIEHNKIMIDLLLTTLEGLRSTILKQAFEGKLVPQDPNDEPAEVLLQKIKQEKEQLIQKQKSSKKNGK